MTAAAKGKIAITGSSGFIGGFLAATLTAAGWQVKGLQRPGRRTARNVTWETVPGSLEDFSSLRRLLAGVEAVVHCAGLVRGASYEDFARVNVTGLQNLLEAVRLCDPPPRIIHFSSLAARQPQLSWYAASKLAGEECLRENCGELDFTILRPPAVYGPGDREMLPLFRLMAKGFAVLPGTGDSRFSLLHVEDLAGAVTRILEAPQPGRVFELHDGREGGYDWFAVIEIAGRLRRRSIRRVKLPIPLLNAVARINLAAARCFSYRPMLTPGKVREIAHPDWVADNRKISAATGWRPQIELARGLGELLDWSA